MVQNNVPDRQLDHARLKGRDDGCEVCRVAIALALILLRLAIFPSPARRKAAAPLGLQILAMFRIKNDDVLRRLKRYPASVVEAVLG